MPKRCEKFVEDTELNRRILRLVQKCDKCEYKKKLDEIIAMLKMIDVD